MKCLVLGVWCLAGLPLLAASLDEQGFVRDWLVSGPWPSYQDGGAGKGLDTDFIPPEEEAQPFAGLKASATFVADWSKLVAGIEATNEWGFRTNVVCDTSWRPLHAKEGIIRFNGTFGPIDDFFVVYAACYVDSPREQPARLAVGSDDDHKVFLNLTQVGKARSSQDVLPGTFKYDVVLPKGRSRLLFKLQDRKNGCGFCVQLTDRAGAPLRDVAIVLDTRGVPTVLDALLAERRSPARLRARMDAARKTIEESRAALQEVRAERTVLSNACAAAKKSLSDAYAAREAKYAAEHAAAAAKGTRSVAEPFAPLARRSTLCLNGRWESSADGKTWGRTYLPTLQLNSYFQSWRYPVKKDGRPHPAYVKEFDPVPFAEKPRFRTTFAWDGVSDVTFRCDAIIGVTPTVSVNGVVCGSWNGDRGVVRIPLKGLRKGENTLEIVSPRGRGDLTYGIRGDLWLETLPKVRVDDVWVKTSWRKSALGAKTELVNRTDADVTAKVAAYAVKDGKVRFRLPVRDVAVAAHGTAVVKAQAAWADPETWGIGGRYGEPNLYTLVTDVSVNGEIVDRHEVEFGFREFWICHTDFFLNGRRILLRGDVGHMRINDKRRRDVIWPLYRRDGINLVRVHDSDQWSVTAVRDADRMGMAVYAQMYPILSEPGAKHGPTEFAPFDAWEGTETHRRNLAAYERWWRDFRNHPSVLIWSTDNEIFTQAWDVESRVAFNIRNDRIGALYEKHMKKLDPSLVVSRDGDVGTWNRQARWFEDPPCETANYHYPDFNNDDWAEAWQLTYQFRPIIFGEALYCSYFANGWVGGRPKLVADKAAWLRRCLPLYEDLGVPCVIFMGLGLDGFTLADDTGKGNPWGLKASDVAAFNREGRPIPNRRADQYPWLRIDWPAYSGEGGREPADHINACSWGTEMVNVYEPGVPSHVRNAVNEAYRSYLPPQPPVDAGRFAEAIVTAGAYADVWTATTAGNRTGVRADGEGRAWFRSLAPGPRVFSCGAAEKSVDLPMRGADVAKPGFTGIPKVRLND